MFGNIIGHKIIELEETDSTNSYAARLIYDQSPVEGTVIMAGFQSAGKGQRGSGWESKKNQNLLISIILYPGFLAASEHFLLNQAISLSIFDFVQQISPSDVSIKWPNDILVGNKKIAGILIENTIRNNKFSSSIVGIGININQSEFNAYTPEATSLKFFKHKTFEIKECLNMLTIQFDKWYLILKSGNYKKITESYSNALFGIGDELKFESDGENFTGVIKGVNTSGQLLLTKSTGADLVFSNKELKFKI